MSDDYSVPKPRSRKPAPPPDYDEDEPISVSNPSDEPKVVKKVAATAPVVKVSATKKQKASQKEEYEEEKEVPPSKKSKSAASVPAAENKITSKVTAVTRKPAIEPDFVVADTDGRKSKKISLANLRADHSNSLSYHIAVKCVSKRPLKTITVKKTGKKSKVFACVLSDSTGRCIQFDSWDLSELHNEYFEVGKYYKLSAFSVKKTNDWDKKDFPTNEYKLSGDGALALEELDSLDFKAAPKLAIKKLEQSIQSLQTLYQKFEAKEVKETNVNIVGTVLDHTEVKRFQSKKGNDIVLSTVTIGDESLHSINFNIWGEDANKQRFKKNEIVTVESTKLNFEQGVLDLKWGTIRTLNEAEIAANPQIQKLQEWVSTSTKNISTYKNLSAKVGGAFGAAAASYPRILAHQLTHWRIQAKDNIQKWIDCGRISKDPDTGALEPFSDEMKKMLPHGRFKLVGQICNVSDTLNKDANLKSAKAAFATTLLYPACPNVAKHGQFRALAEYNSGTWRCRKCEEDYEDCLYGIKADLDFVDIHPLSLRSWTVQGLLPDDLTLEEIVKQVKSMAIGDGIHVTKSADADDEGDGKEGGAEGGFDSEDHIVYNKAIMNNTKYHVVNRPNRLFQLAIELVPDHYSGLLFKVLNVGSVDLGAEIEYLTDYIQALQ